MRMAAARALGALGDDAAAAKLGVADAHKRAYKALDLVWEDVEDTDEDVRNACGEALQELGHGVW